MSTPIRRARPVRPPAGPVALFPHVPKVATPASLWESITRSMGAMDAKAPFAHPITQVMRPDLPVRGGEPPRGIVRSNLG